MVDLPDPGSPTSAIRNTVTDTSQREETLSVIILGVINTSSSRFVDFRVLDLNKLPR